MYNLLLKKKKKKDLQCVYIYICVYTHKNISSKKHNYIVLLVHDSWLMDSELIILKSKTINLSWICREFYNSTNLKFVVFWNEDI